MEHFPLEKKLHTDVLEGSYGPIRAEVVRHDDEIREAHLVDKEGISRTYALTFLTFDRNNLELSNIDKKIQNGGEIGKTFRDHGYTIRKNVVAVYIVDQMPNFLKDRFKVDSKSAKARLSEFYACKEGGKPFIYGIVTEIYSPDFRPPEVNEVDVEQDNPTTHALEMVGFTKEEVWKRLGNGNMWEDVEDRYKKAQELARTEEEHLQDQVRRYLYKND